MQLPQSSLNGAQSYYDAQRQQSLELYELQRGLPAGDIRLAGLTQWLRRMLHRPEEQPTLTWQNRSTSEAMES